MRELNVILSSKLPSVSANFSCSRTVYPVIRHAYTSHLLPFVFVIFGSASACNVLLLSVVLPW